MQSPTTQGMTRAQANSVRSTCTACHQRKVKCDAHDRGYPCSRCVKSGAASDCRLHRKNKRVSRARQVLSQQQQQQQQQQPESSNNRSRPYSKAETPLRNKRLPPIAAAQSLPVEETTVALPLPAPAPALASAITPAVAAATPGSLFLQTVIASDARGNCEADIDQDADAEGEEVRIIDGPHTPRDSHVPFSDAGLTGGGTVGSTAASTTTASTPAIVAPLGVDGEYKKYLVEFIDQPQLAERPIDKTARILYVGSPLSNMHFLLRQRMARAAREQPQPQPHLPHQQSPPSDARSGASTAHAAIFANDVVHYPTNRIAKPSAGLGGLAADGLPFEAFQLPPKRTVDQLLAAYLQHINPGFPVVDGRLLMRQYRARDPQNPPSLLLLQAMLVAGAHVHYTDPGERAAHKALFFRRAKMLLDARVERNRDTVVQAALLLTWHADGPEDVAANAWHWIGLAARTATGLGMHRDAEASTLVAHNKRMWRRVWWLLVACDVLVALQYGRPPALHLDDTDVQPPVAADFADCGEGTRVDYVLRLVQLCILLSTHVLRRQFRGGGSVRATATTNKPAVSAAASSLRRTDEALANWFLHLPPSLQIGGLGNGMSASPSSTTAGASINVWTAFLHLTYNTALLVLHRQVPSPSSFPPATTSSSSSSLQSSSMPSASSADDVEICTNAAVAIQQICHAVCASGQAVYLWSPAINSLFTALIQLSGDVQRSTMTSTTAKTGTNTNSNTNNPATSSSSLVDTGNPLLAVAALRRYDGALASLRQLAVYWPNAQAIVQFFEQSVQTAAPVTTSAGAMAAAADGIGMDSAESPCTATPLPVAPAAVPMDTISKEQGLHGRHDHISIHRDHDNTLAPHVEQHQLHHDHMHQDQADVSDPDEMAHHLLSGLAAASRQSNMPYDGREVHHLLHQHHHQQQNPADLWNSGTASVFNTDWQRIYWQQPELTDDFLFNF